jgi:hypothetical protein
VNKILISALFSISAATFGGAAIAQEAAPAAQAAAPAPVVGAKVYDSTGGEVGTIESVDAGNFVISTGKNKAGIANASLAKDAQGRLVIGMTKAQLDAAVEAANGGAANKPAATAN